MSNEILLSKSGFVSSEQPPPVENEKIFLVSMGEVKFLIPGTSDYNEYDGLKTVGLSSCVGFAVFIPRCPEENCPEPILGLGHLDFSRGDTF
jgi:hypothetical protein